MDEQTIQALAAKAGVNPGWFRMLFNVERKAMHRRALRRLNSKKQT